MPFALGLIQLINAATPGIASLVLLIKKRDGTIAVATLLDEADAQFDANIQEATAWLKAHAASAPAIPTQ